jgi:hypothetical protein
MVTVMTTPRRIRAIGRGLVIIGLLLLPFRLAVYLTNKVLMKAGFVCTGLFAVGFLLWIVGAVMAGYTERAAKSLQR